MKLPEITFKICLLLTAIILLTISGCGRKSEPEYYLEEFIFDYHFMKYETLKSSDVIYSPENVILIFRVDNSPERTIDYALYSKRNRQESLSAFCVISKEDTIVLRSVKDNLNIPPNQEGRVCTEFPFERFDFTNEILKSYLSGKTSSEEQFSIIFKKLLNDRLSSTVNIKKAKGKLSCSDTTLAFQIF